MAKGKTTTIYRTPIYRTPIHNELSSWAAHPYNPSKFEILPVTDFLRRIHTIENEGSILHRGAFTSFYETANVYARLGISLASGLGMSEPYATAKSNLRVLEIRERLDALEECCNAAIDKRALWFDDELMRLRCNSVVAAKLASEIYAMAINETGAAPAKPGEAGK